MAVTSTYSVPAGSSFSVPAYSLAIPGGDLLVQFTGPDQASVTVQVVGNTSGKTYWDAVGPAVIVDLDVEDTFLAITLTGTNVAGTLTILNKQPVPGPPPGPVAPVFNVKNYGAVGDGVHDDTAAIQAAVDAAANGGVVWLPAGSFAVTAPITVTGKQDFDGDGTLLATTSMESVLSVTQSTAQRFHVNINGNGNATNCVAQSWSPETSIGTVWDRCSFQGATSYQMSNVGCEDVVYFACYAQGDPTNWDALSISIPDGAAYVFGGRWFGGCSIEAQLMSVYGATIGPFLINNPSALTSWLLRLDGCYIYDHQYSCISTDTNLCNISMTGCYLVTQSQKAFINGNLPNGVSIEATNCLWVGTQTNLAQEVLSASGTGSLVIKGGNTSLGSGSTLVPFGGVGTYDVTVRLSDYPQGFTSTGTPFALPASGTAWTNNTGVDGTLYVTAAGTVTDVVIDGVTVASSLSIGQAFFVPAGGTITFTYSAAPTLAFVGN